MDPRRAMPSVSALLESEQVQRLLEQHPRTVVVGAVRRAVQDARDSGSDEPERGWAERIEAHLLVARRPSLRRVFNATGVVLHTNLGRAPLAAAAIQAVTDAARGYSNLEYDLAKGGRGSRYVHCVELLRELTGAEDAMVVNNCASALVLSLSALARGREVIVSRGELVEIGGSFRVPDIMQRSGARLVEIGTTNRTHLEDYLQAIGPETGAIAKIHRSNFTLSGFVAEVTTRELRVLSSEHDIPVVHDLGSGLMIDLSRFGLTGETTARDSVASGTALTLMSGDKLLGGPQAGIILGTRHAVARLRRDPFARAMRVDKMTIAALGATLELYRDPATALREIPTLSMLTATAASVGDRCHVIQSRLATAGVVAGVVESVSSAGGGAFPGAEIPSFALALPGDAIDVEKALRAGETPVIARIVDDRLLLDVRSVPPVDDADFSAAVVAALA